jgi:glycosyltransferase involved in cell wall biosynthesis
LNAVRTAESLDHDRFALTLFHMHSDGPLRRRYEALRIPMHRVHITNLYSPATVRESWRVARVLRSADIDVVHTHDVYTNIFFAPWARAVTDAGVITSRRWSGALPREALSRANAFAHRCSHRVLANSASVARLLEAEGVPARKISEIPNFLDDESFSDADFDVGALWRASHGLPRDAFLIGTVARLVPVKNHAMLLVALARLPGDCHVVLIGDGTSRRMLESMARELGIESRVHFLGTMLDAGNLHRHLDVSVLCSNDEGFPNAVIEAFAAAKPVVATNVGGVPDVVQSDVNGLLVPRGDSEALVAAITRLHSNRSLASQFGMAGRALVKERYSRSAVMARLSLLYARAAGSRTALRAATQAA